MRKLADDPGEISMLMIIIFLLEQLIDIKENFFCFN